MLYSNLPFIMKYWLAFIAHAVQNIHVGPPKIEWLCSQAGSKLWYNVCTYTRQHSIPIIMVEDRLPSCNLLIIFILLVMFLWEVLEFSFNPFLLINMGVGRSSNKLKEWILTHWVTDTRTRESYTLIFYNSKQGLAEMKSCWRIHRSTVHCACIQISS